MPTGYGHLCGIRQTRRQTRRARQAKRRHEGNRKGYIARIAERVIIRKFLELVLGDAPSVEDLHRNVRGMRDDHASRIVHV